MPHANYSGKVCPIITWLVQSNLGWITESLKFFILLTPITVSMLP